VTCEAETLQVANGPAAQMLRDNLAQLQDKIDKGFRIFDLGKDALRDTASDFFGPELELLAKNGLTQKFVK
jgi:hypothetical protein